MQSSPLNKKVLLLAVLLSIFFLGVYFIRSNNHLTSFIVFCNVGQGDGMYIRLKNNVDIVLDAGPDKSILQCLSKYMPFYDHTIDLAIMSHPDKDHIGGFKYIIDRYTVKKIILAPLSDKTKTFQEIWNQMTTKKIPYDIKYAGDQLSIDTVIFSFYWPQKEYVNRNILFSPNSPIGTSTLPTNDFSYVIEMRQRKNTILLTGDIPNFILLPLMKKHQIDPTIFKLPHHGSKTGVSLEILQLAQNTSAVISVGAHNTYHHPSKETLDLLQALQINYVRTDQIGDVIYDLSDEKGIIRRQ